MLFSIPPILLRFCPLLIVGCFLISFRHWLQARGYQVVAIYLGLSGLSILTAGAVQGLAANTPMGLISRIWIPALYSLIYVSFEVSRSLRSPYRATPQLQRPQSWRLISGTIGGCVGGITGSSLGALVGLLLLLAAPLLTLDLHLGWQMNQAGQRLLEWTTALFGLLGILLGLLVGWGRVNFKQFGDRLLIGLTIQSFLIAAEIRRLLGRGR
ncbi:MAG: hypothetical protein ACKO7W_15400 [Elainella sp.]